MKIRNVSTASNKSKQLRNTNIFKFVELYFTILARLTSYIPSNEEVRPQFSDSHAF